MRYPHSLRGELPSPLGRHDKAAVTKRCARDRDAPSKTQDKNAAGADLLVDAYSSALKDDAPRTTHQGRRLHQAERFVMTQNINESFVISYARFFLALRIFLPADDDGLFFLTSFFICESSWSTLS